MNNRLLKKIILGVIVLTLISTRSLLVCAEDENTPIKFSGGEGTEDNPYLISSSSDLIAISDIYSEDPYIREAYFMLTKNINLKKTVWKPIGSHKFSFSGTFDGNGKTITIRNIASGNFLGIFGIADSRSTIKNLTVKGAINKKINSKNEVYFGLIAGRAEGIVENCITEGKVTLTVNTSKDFCFGGVIGFGDGTIRNIQNNAALVLKNTGNGYTALGGIVGSMHGNKNSISAVTNTGSIDANVNGRIFTGGISGEYINATSLYSAQNEGNISVETSLKEDKERCATGGIVGSIMGSSIDRALNKGKVFMSYNEEAKNVEIITGGITGIAQSSKLANVGNQGTVETSGRKVIYAAGIIGNVGREVSLDNAYNTGKIYGVSPDKNSELYISGMVSGIAVVNNFYNSGSVRLKAANLKEIDGEAFTNIRPGENTKTFNYCYWNKGLLPFPLLQKSQATTSEFNPKNGILSRKVTIKGKKYSDLSVALNAWVSAQKDGYVKWTGKKTPVFKESFGFLMNTRAMLKQ